MARRRLPTILQRRILENRCEKLNEEGCGDVDFRSLIDESLTFGENQSNLEAAYPGKNWTETVIGPRTFEKYQVQEAESLVDEFSFGVFKKSKIEGLERSERRAVRLGKKLETCEAVGQLPRKTPPGTCKLPSVAVKRHYRCPPRR